MKYLVKEIELGQSIGELASLGKDEILARMNSEELKETVDKTEDETYTTDPLIKDLEQCLTPLDQSAFKERLREIIALLPFEEVFKRVLIPLQIRVGELWFDGKVGIAVEHYVTTQVKQKLFAVMDMMGMQNGPKVIIACPPWELHEIGAQMVAYHCSGLGCQAILLGANLPLEDLIHFCTGTKPDALVLSFTSPLGEAKSRVFFAEIANHILPLCPVVAGGQGIAQRENYIENKNIKIIKTLPDLDTFINNLIASS